MKFAVIKIPRNNEYTYDQALALISSLSSRAKNKGLLSMFSKSPKVYYSFNIIAVKQTIYFIAGTQDQEYSYLKDQILARYGTADLIDLDSFEEFTGIGTKKLTVAELVYSGSDFLSIKTIDQFAETDPLASVLSTISRFDNQEGISWIQLIIAPIDSSWVSRASYRMGALSGSESKSAQSEIAQIQEKIKHSGYKVNLRIIADDKSKTDILSNSFSIFSQSGGNRLILKTGLFANSGSAVKSAVNNTPGKNSILMNTLEIATLWHLPAGNINIPNIGWGKNLQLEPPENLPIAYEGITKEDKKGITFIGKTIYKNKEYKFGIKSGDRMRHVYIVGKTGTGKSVLIDNMAIEDIRKGKGIAVLDPHGDAIENIIQYIPRNRINDVCYFDPSDKEYAYPLNILETYDENQKELLVSGIIAIFYKLYSNSWGPRLEHILRNILFTLVQTENATLPDVLKILHNKKYRQSVLEKINDPTIEQFWRDEFEKMSENFMNEAISPILNKVGQFVTSPMIRKIIQHPRSKVKIQEIMDNNKILLCDLSQGKIGEDNSTLLGSMIITQIQIAAMNRAYQKEAERVPFYLYVDEFQNFATSAFTKILPLVGCMYPATMLTNVVFPQPDFPTIEINSPSFI